MPVQPEDEYFVFGFLDRRPLGYEGTHNAFESIIKEARGEGILPSEDERWITPHAARHSLNANLLAFGLSPLLVQTFLGWSSAESRVLTRLQASYTHLRVLKVLIGKRKPSRVSHLIDCSALEIMVDDGEVAPNKHRRKESPQSKTPPENRGVSILSGEG